MFSLTFKILSVLAGLGLLGLLLFIIYLGTSDRCTPGQAKFDDGVWVCNSSSRWVRVKDSK